MNLGVSAPFFALVALFSVAAHAAQEAPCMGFFVDWARRPDGGDAGGREANLRARENALGAAPSSLLALDFYGVDSWEEMKSYRWVPAYWAKQNPKRKLIWSIALTTKGVPLAKIAAGEHDADFVDAAVTIAAAQPDGVIRIGWEMNGDWYPWASKGVEKDYIAAFRRVRGIFHSASRRFTFAWTPNAGAMAGSPDLAYPGDDVVDTVGLDIYDAPSPLTPAAAWEAAYSGPFGLAWLEEFSRRHRKPMHLGEWGVGLLNGPDNPLFIEKMHGWLRDHARSIAFHVYFDVSTSNLESGRFPNSRKRFYELFAVGDGNDADHARSCAR